MEAPFDCDRFLRRAWPVPAQVVRLLRSVDSVRAEPVAHDAHHVGQAAPRSPGGVKPEPMTARDGLDLFGLSPAPALAADHTAVLVEWKQGLARLASTRAPCPGFRAGQWLS